MEVFITMKCIVFQNVCDLGDNIFTFPGYMKGTCIYAFVANDSLDAKCEELQQINPVETTEEYRLYDLEEYLFATSCAKDWYDIMVYKLNNRYGYIEAKSGKMLTTARFAEAQPLYDWKDSAVACEEFNQCWRIDKEGNITKTRMRV